MSELTKDELRVNADIARGEARGIADIARNKADFERNAADDDRHILERLHDAETLLANKVFSDVCAATHRELAGKMNTLLAAIGLSITVALAIFTYLVKLTESNAALKATVDLIVKKLGMN